jgi:hypothetical protein
MPNLPKPFPLRAKYSADRANERTDPVSKLRLPADFGDCNKPTLESSPSKVVDSDELLKEPVPCYKFPCSKLVPSHLGLPSCRECEKADRDQGSGVGNGRPGEEVKVDGKKGCEERRRWVNVEAGFVWLIIELSA